MVEDFELLRPEDIPPRRRSPREPEDEDDLLTKELFDEPAPRTAGLTRGSDELTKVIFADVQPASHTAEPQTVNLSAAPARVVLKPAPPAQKGEPRPRGGSHREKLLRAIEGMEEVDFELIRKYSARPTQTQTKESRRPRLRYADYKPHRLKTPRPIKKILLAAVLLGVLGVIPAAQKIAGLKGENFLGGASFVVPNQSKTSPLGEFLNILLARDGDYLVVGANGARNAPIGAEPATYALVQIRSGQAGVAREGSVAELNAALPAKIIPPKPIQVLKTNFDFFETGWFFGISDFARAFGDLFAETSGEQPEGVVLVSSELAARLVSARGLSLNPNEPGWIRPLLSSLLGGAQQDVIVSAIAARELQFHFFDESLMNQAQSLGLAASLSLPSGTDAFLAGFRSWEGGRAELELVDYQPDFFVDGSIVSTLDLRLANPQNEPLTIYAKIAVPKGSILLAEAGFADPLAPPAFDYASHGFKPNPYTSAPLSLPADFFPRLDFFEEGPFAVVGGWVRFAPLAVQTLSIRYRLPYRLDWQRGLDTYRLEIFKSGLAGEIPFRYQASLEAGVDFEWRQPSGYRAAGLAEYQTTLRRDETLRATLKYQK